MSTEPEAIEVFYMNWRGELRVRKLRPVGMVEWRTEPPWHPEPQWLMRAVDAETGQIRSFALNGLAGPDAIAPIAGPIAGWIAQMINSALQAKLAKVSKLSRSRLKHLRELDAKVQAAETVRAELHTLGVRLGEVLAENMQLAANQCEGPMIGDEHGHFSCGKLHTTGGEVSGTDNDTR